MKKYATCTLFEKHYHHGVGVLTNSLARNGFKGDMYVGFRGPLPPWAKTSQPNPALNWKDATSMKVTDQVNIHFLPNATNAHFTNYKAHFMLELINGPAKDIDAIYYFDPDIVFVADWKYFMEWVEIGVAVCEDVNSPVWKNNHRRAGWRKFFAEFGHELKFKEPVYVNGGFIGVSKENFKMLELWREMMENVAPRIGGLNKSPISGEAMPAEELGPFTLFGKSDQDVLNAALEAYDGTISYAGKEGMGFISGAALIPHALGAMKPWLYQPIKEMINGVTPRTVDKHYWKYADQPLQAHSPAQVKSMKRKIKIASLVGRFYKRGEQ